MILTRESYLNYIPFSFIQPNDRSFRFRLIDSERFASLKSSLVRSGQTHPTILEEVGPENFNVIDGHCRCDAVHKIRETGGSWEKILAHVIPSHTLTVLDRFRLIYEKNVHGDHPFGLIERARFFKGFREFGLSLGDMSAETNTSSHTIEDLIDLGNVHASLELRLNKSQIDPTFALMLMRRFQVWVGSPFQGQALGIVDTLLAHAANEKMSIRSWRFLLDFYWSRERPFMSSAS
jgi:hypothetical protein